MADTGIFATTAEVQYKAGANCSATANTETYINSYMTQAESYINVKTRVNWSDLYASLNVDVKGILKMAASCLAAMWVIQYDMSAMGLSEGTKRLDVLRDGFVNAMEALKEEANRIFLEKASRTS